MSPLLAQLVETPDSTAGMVVWLVVGAVIFGLYLVLRRTRRRALEDYWERRRREEQRRRDDPDMRRDPE